MQINVEFTEQDARKYIKGLILSGNKVLRDKALEHFKKRLGHSFWETKVPVRPESLTNLPKTPEEIAKQIGLI